MNYGVLFSCTTEQPTFNAPRESEIIFSCRSNQQLPVMSEDYSFSGAQIGFLCVVLAHAV